MADLESDLRHLASVLAYQHCWSRWVTFPEVLVSQRAMINDFDDDMYCPQAICYTGL